MRAVGETLSADNFKQLWVPPGFAHGFCALSEQACFAYKCTGLYAREHELGVAFDDPEVGIEWPSLGDAPPIVSAKDRALPRLSEIPEARLPRWPGA